MTTFSFGSVSANSRCGWRSLMLQPASASRSCPIFWPFFFEGWPTAKRPYFSYIVLTIERIFAGSWRESTASWRPAGIRELRVRQSFLLQSGFKFPALKFPAISWKPALLQITQIAGILLVKRAPKRYFSVKKLVIFYNVDGFWWLFFRKQLFLKEICFKIFIKWSIIWKNFSRNFEIFTHFSQNVSNSRHFLRKQCHKILPGI